MNKFENNDALCQKLALDVCAALVSGIEKNGTAILAVSGGNTPKKFFQTLSTKKLPWHNVIVTLVDERWVDADDERSNARLVHKNLLIKQAAAAKFIPLYNDCADLENAFIQTQTKLAKLAMPFDAVILGMGGDGHTASFFPGGDNLAQAVDRAGKNLVSFMSANAAGELRITLTLPVLIKAGYLALHIEGNEKLGVFEKANMDGDVDLLPVRHVIGNAKDLQIYWAA